MKKRFVIVLLSVLMAGTCVKAQAQKVNVVSVSKDRDIHNFYTMMREAFPLAYNDPAAPRFIFFDDNKNFIFGVGGYVQLSGVYDFNGVENYNTFTTSTIALKGHQPGSSYGMTVGQSRLFFKLIGDTNVGRLVSYIEMEFVGPQSSPILRQAFVQFKGFTLGQTWSTFGDMTAVPTTIDEEGPCSGIEIRQPMIRYTYDYNDALKISLALEYGKVSMTPDQPEIRAIRQKVPDIPLTIRYQSENGSHIQAGGILRVMTYKDFVNNDDKVKTGWGAMLSGKLNLSESNSFMFQGVYGKGIARYIQDISGLVSDGKTSNGYDLVPDPDRAGHMQLPTTWGAFGAFQQNWNENLYSTLVYSYTRVQDKGGLANTSYKYAQYAAVNLLWNFTEFGTTGIEYVFGRRNDFNRNYGNANRINAMIQYRF